MLAVAAGRVVEAVDRYPNQVPNANVPVPVEEADGNHLIVRLGKGVYAGYAHLERGSLRVHRGERVRAGQASGVGKRWRQGLTGLELMAFPRRTP